MNQESSAVVFLAVFLELLNFLEFLTSPVGLTIIFGLGLFWSCEYLLGLELVVAATIAGVASTQLYYWLIWE
ncbi:hypothetical protein [Lyngbya aestuarii]|uniref:hypothetical protein n=1 Tax=Lyngbya aestuarii TaxID=118322 RepID=UPI00403DE542